jgi:hypothetical protein
VSTIEEQNKLLRTAQEQNNPDLLKRDGRWIEPWYEQAWAWYLEAQRA